MCKSFCNKSIIIYFDIIYDGTNNSNYNNLEIYQNNGDYIFHIKNGHKVNLSYINFTENNASYNAGFFFNFSTRNNATHTTLYNNTVINPGQSYGGAIIGMDYQSWQNRIINTYSSRNNVTTDPRSFTGGAILGASNQSNQTIIHNFTSVGDNVRSERDLAGGGILGLWKSSHSNVSEVLIRDADIWVFDDIWGGMTVGADDLTQVRFTNITIHNVTVVLDDDQLKGALGFGMNDVLNYYHKNIHISNSNFSAYDYIRGGGAVGFDSSDTFTIENITVENNTIYSHSYTEGGQAVGTYQSDDGYIDAVRVFNNNFTTRTQLEGGQAVGGSATDNVVFSNISIMNSSFTLKNEVRGGVVMGLYQSSGYNEFINIEIIGITANHSYLSGGLAIGFRGTSSEVFDTRVEDIFIHDVRTNFTLPYGVVGINKTNLTRFINVNITDSASPYSFFDQDAGFGWTNYLIYNNTFGEIDLIGRQDNLTIRGNTTFGDEIKIFYDNIIVNETLLPDWNTTANLSLFQTPAAGIPYPIIQRNGVSCTSATDPSCHNFTSLSAPTVVFNVSGFSIYNISRSQGCGDLSGGATLDYDLNTSGTCFNIIADDVVLDCAGKSITGKADGGYGINTTGFDNFQLLNCRIENFTRAIYIEDGHNHKYLDITLHENDGDYAFKAYDANYLNITNLNISKNFANKSAGLDLQYVNHSHVYNLDFQSNNATFAGTFDNEAALIALKNSYNTTLNNIIDRNSTIGGSKMVGLYGLINTNSSDLNNITTSNTTIHVSDAEGGAMLSLSASHSNTIRNITLYDSQLNSSLQVVGGLGIGLNRSDKNTIVKVNISSVDLDGFNGYAGGMILGLHYSDLNLIQSVVVHDVDSNNTNFGTGGAIGDSGGVSNVFRDMVIQKAFIGAFGTGAGGLLMGVTNGASVTITNVTMRDSLAISNIAVEGAGMIGVKDTPNANISQILLVNVSARAGTFEGAGMIGSKSSLNTRIESIEIQNSSVYAGDIDGGGYIGAFQQTKHMFDSIILLDNNVTITATGTQTIDGGGLIGFYQADSSNATNVYSDGALVRTSSGFGGDINGAGGLGLWGSNSANITNITMINNDIAVNTIQSGIVFGLSSGTNNIFNNVTTWNTATSDDTQTGLMGISAALGSNVFINVNLSGNATKSFYTSGGATPQKIMYSNQYGEIVFQDQILIQSPDIDGNMTFGENIIIAQNRLEINTTRLRDLNVSANLTLKNTPSSGVAVPFINIDGELCKSDTDPACYNFTALTAATVRFNATSWSVYNISGSPGCSDLSESYRLYENHTTAGTCFNIQSNNVELDCQGFAIFGKNDGGYGINVSDRQNFTLKNCIISNFTRAIH